MKLYIPTTTLNFNNILSSETVSPKAFYSLRGYGYRTWETVDYNNLENCILLYRKPFSFTCHNNGLDDYPMLIEVDVSAEKLVNFEKCDDWGYKSGCSVLLTPVTAKFIFFTEKHLEIALSRSDFSLETKLTRLYAKRFVVERYPEITLPRDIQDLGKPDMAAMETDRRMNKMKGFMYGYIIGRMLSIDDDNLSKLKAMYEICDVVAAILSGIGGNMQIAQVDSLKDKLVVIDPFYSDCVKSFGKEKASEIYNFIRQTYLNNHLWANDYFVRIKSMLSDENKWEELQTWLSEMLDEIKYASSG